MAEYVLLGEKYCSLLKPALSKLNYTVLSVPDNPCVDPRLSGHADLCLFYDGGREVFAANYLKNAELHILLIKNGINISFLDENQGEKYPNDVQLNVCLTGNSFIFNPKTACPELVDHLFKQGREGIECRQGYSRCSVCVVDDSSIITSDRGIAEKCREKGLDVLEIAPGYIDLEGFDYGFIGGASIKLSDKLLAFTGKLTAHPQYREIEAFIASKDVETVFLTEQPAFDIGSAHIIKT